MAAPNAPLQVCVLVSYPHGYAALGLVPNIAVFARVDPSDESDSGILMRVERCQGASCAGFGFRGNGSLQFVGSGNPQAEYVDTGAYATIYRYRVRMENVDGASAWSSTVQIDTTVHGTAGCDSGSITALTEQIKISAGHGIVEYTVNRAQIPAGIGIVEYTLDRLQINAGCCILEYYDDGGAPPPQPRAMAGIVIVEYYDNVTEPEEPPPTDPNDPGPTDDSHCLCR